MMTGLGIKNLELTGCDRIEHSEDGQLIHIRIPIIFRRRGGRSLVMTPDGQPLTPPKEHPAPALRDALVPAYRWLSELEKGKVKSLDEIAKSENITAKGRVSALIRLTSLAPTIQKSILTGDNLGYLTLEDCLKPFPEEWEKQQAHFNTFSRSHHSTES